MLVKGNGDGTYSVNGRRYKSRKAAVAASRRAKLPTTASRVRKRKKRKAR